MPSDVELFISSVSLYELYIGATTPEKENDIELITEDISSRKDEILQWYTKKRMPNEEFVIIDDDKMLNGLPENIKHNLVLTSPSIGLTDDLADEAISILQKSAYQYH